MKFVKQTKLHIPDEQNGNCFAAVISSITEIPLEEVLQVENSFHKADWHLSLFGWLLQRGWLWRGGPEFEWYYGCGRQPEYITTEMVKDRPYMVSGKTNRFGGTVNHVCIYMNGELLHDPHPEGSGLTTLEFYEVIEKFSTHETERS